MIVKQFIKKFIPDFLLDFYHYCWALVGAVFYGFPSRKIKIIGATGTKGKSTVVNLITAILEEAGYKTASLSSIKFKIGNKEWKNKLKMTMPGRLKIQKFLNQAVKEKCQYVVLEVTSEGIKQHRHQFINFDTAVFTNLSPEHIESHHGFENYRKAKMKLFRATKGIHVVNLDDENAKWFLDMPAGKKYVFKIKNQKSKIKMTNQNVKCFEAENIRINPNSVNFNLQGVSFSLNLLGEFNIYNALAAVCVGLSQGVSLEICKKALEKIKGIPGRMEIVIDKPFKVIVDYAHNPDSLESAYKAAKNFNPSSMICVLGACGGGRDKWKRPVLGKIASQYCDKIIITNEDPYDENPFSIMDEIEKGFSQIPNSKHQILNKFQIPNSKFQNVKYEKILDRRKAIRKSLELANPNDVVIITGKGSESWICVENGKKIPWSDKEIIKEEFQKLKITKNN